MFIKNLCALSALQSVPLHTRAHSDNPLLALFSHPTLGWGFCRWFCFWTPLYQRAWTWHRDRCCLKKQKYGRHRSIKSRTEKHKSRERRRNSTSPVSDGQIVSSLQLDVQLVHSWATDGSLRRDARGAWGTHNLLDETHGFTTAGHKISHSIIARTYCQSKLTNISKGNNTCCDWSVAFSRSTCICGQTTTNTGWRS